MNQMPMNPLTPEQQSRLLGQMYALMGKQVQSYNKQRHTPGTSVPAELARELMESMEYTLDQAGGVWAHADLEEGLVLGQTVLEEKHRKAQAMLELVRATGPNWQTECRWEALVYMGHYLEAYDWKHLAHRGPEELFYPILTAPSEGIRGIDLGLFYLNVLWIENQIFAAVPEVALEALWDRLPESTLNPCEQLLVNAMGRLLLGKGLEVLTFGPEEQLRLFAILHRASPEELKSAAGDLCRELGLQEEAACQYVTAITGPLAFWAREQVIPDGLFL